MPSYPHSLYKHWFKHSSFILWVSISKIKFPLWNQEIHQTSMHEHCGICSRPFKATNEVEESKIKWADSQAVLRDAAFPILVYVVISSCCPWVNVSAIKSSQCIGKKGVKLGVIVDIVRDQCWVREFDMKIVEIALRDSNKNFLEVSYCSSQRQCSMWRDSTYFEIVSFECWNLSPRCQTESPVTQAYRKIAACSSTLTSLQDVMKPQISWRWAQKDMNTCSCIPSSLKIWSWCPWINLLTQASPERADVW